MATYTKSRVFVAVVSKHGPFANECGMLIMPRNITRVFKCCLLGKEKFVVDAKLWNDY